MTTQEIRVWIMKTHMRKTTLSKHMGVPPVQIDRWLDDDNLPEEIKQKFIDAMNEILPTWKVGIALESTKRGKLIKDYMIENYRKEKMKRDKMDSSD